MRISFLIASLLIGLLAGCATAPPPAAPGSTSPPATATLAAEQQRFAALFAGTPVVFEMQPDGGLRVTVPLHFSFASGRAVVQPPLAAVLDRVARSQRGTTTRFRVAAPADPPGNRTRLAQERAQSTRDYLVSRGIAPTRFLSTAAAAGDLVLISVIDTSAL